MVGIHSKSHSFYYREINWKYIFMIFKARFAEVDEHRRQSSSSVPLKKKSFSHRIQPGSKFKLIYLRF